MIRLFSRSAGAFLAAIVVLAVSAGAASAQHLYWTNFNGTLNSYDLATNTDQVLVNDAGSAPNGVAVDRATGRIYWAVRDNNEIRSVASDGSDMQTLISGALGEPVGVAIDGSTRTLYWADEDDSQIGWTKLDGSANGHLNTGSADIDSPQGLALDVPAGRVYWSNTDGSGVSDAGWASLDGSGTGGTIGGPVSGTPVGFALVPELQEAFWAGYNDSLLHSALTDGSSVTQTVSTPPGLISAPGGVGYNPVDGRIYISNYGTGNLVWSTPDGSATGTLSNTLGGAGPWGSPAFSGAGKLTAAAPVAINAVAGSSGSGTLKLTNTGDFPLEIYAITTSGSSAFTAGSCPSRVAIGADCSLAVQFAPATSGAASATVTVRTDAGDFSFPVTGNRTDPLLRGVHAVRRCAASASAGGLSVKLTSNTAVMTTVSLQRWSTHRRSLPARCPRTGSSKSTDHNARGIGKRSKRAFSVKAGSQTASLKQLLGVKKLTPGHYRLLFTYAGQNGATAKKGTWFWVLP